MAAFKRHARSVGVVTVLAGTLAVAGPAGAEPLTPAATHQVVHGWPELPEGEILGQATGVDVDPQGNVWVFHRAGRTWSDPFPTDPIAATTVWVFDARTGKRLEAWGAGRFIMPHGLTVDREGNVWLTDVGLHQVFKFSAGGELLLTLGVAGVAANDATHFDMPTDVAVAKKTGYPSRRAFVP